MDTWDRLRLVLGLVLVTLLVVIVLQNLQPVRVSFLVGHVEMAAATLIAFSAVAGAVAQFVLRAWWRSRRDD